MVISYSVTVNVYVIRTHQNSSGETNNRLEHSEVHSHVYLPGIIHGHPDIILMPVVASIDLI